MELIILCIAALILLAGKHADKPLVIRFGIPAFFAALLGAYLLLQISDLQPILTYTLGSKEFHITPQ